jgi:hypothetical protein
MQSRSGCLGAVSASSLFRKKLAERRTVPGAWHRFKQSDPLELLKPDYLTVTDSLAPSAPWDVAIALA